MPQRMHPVIVMGAGPGGLAASHELRRRNIDHVVLERGNQIAHAWRNLYDSLTLHTGKHMSALPGMSFSASTPLFPSRVDFLNYLDHYATHLPIVTDCHATHVLRLHDTWKLQTAKGELEAKALVVATGILSNPTIPVFAGRERYRGHMIHSVDYRRPGEFVGRRVLVIGVGNSGGEISSELARHGAHVTIAVRSGAMVLPRQLFGIPIQYFSYLMMKLPRTVQQTLTALLGQVSQLTKGPAVLPRPAPSSCPDVPLIGFHLVDAIRAGLIRVKGPVEGFTEEGARFNDGSEERFEHVIFATGYTAAVGILKGLIQLDQCGFGRRIDRVVSVDQPDLYFVGHNYDGTGGLFNIARDARLVAKRIAAKL